MSKDKNLDIKSLTEEETRLKFMSLVNMIKNGPGLKEDLHYIQLLKQTFPLEQEASIHILFQCFKEVYQVIKGKESHVK